MIASQLVQDLSQRDVWLATRNKGKLRELAAILAGDWNVRGLDQAPPLPDVIEDGDSFEANAQKKACSYSEKLEGWVLADDSGLAVDALGGAPGILSARYAGVHGDDAANNTKLLADMQDVPTEKRTARFVCAIAIARQGQVLSVQTGVCEGRLLETLRGNAGFGYDPLFAPAGYDKTFAELSSEIKNTMSHRAKALAKAVQWLASVDLG